ncbi:unnamed protein product [Toxocara canis]|uniref:DUF7083 domain-containing protein n=1 Tax=Toxocara canis TaxID=6265 RepID=A0A3P7FMI4_TOXCA|nr:unnamed protein product [Toxocara canis]
MQQVGRILCAIGPTASPASTAEFVTNSLSTRLPEFIYDPDNDCTFDVSINRYEDVILQDGSTLDEAAKARLIVSKLDAAAYALATKKNRTRNPSSPRLRCGGSHWAKEWNCIKHGVPQFQTRRSQEGYCKNFANKKKRNLKKRRTTNNFVVIAPTGTDIASVNRIYRNIQISGTTIQMRFDTAVDVTLLSVKDWAKINRPKLLPPLVELKSAHNKDIRFRGYFGCDFDIDGHKGR